MSIGRLALTIFSVFLVTACSTPIKSTPIKSPELMSHGSDDSPFNTAEKNKDTWTWIPAPEMICRDGSTSGIGLRLRDNADGVLIYFQGGGACYDSLSCSLNADSRVAGSNYGFPQFSKWSRWWGQRGIFNIRNAKNPVRQWNHVYIPYCSGDLFAGQQSKTLIEQVEKPQQFLGHQNTTRLMTTIAEYFSNPQSVLVAGASSGGLGVMFNYDKIAEAFKPAAINALIDSAPFLIDENIDGSCFQKKIISTFDLRLPEDCPACAQYSNGGFAKLYEYLGTKYPNAKFGLTSAESDVAGVLLMNKESHKCGGEGVNLLRYRQGLLELRKRELTSVSNWSSFFWKGIEHTATQNDQMFYRNKAGGKSMAEWLYAYLRGSTIHSGP